MAQPPKRAESIVVAQQFSQVQLLTLQRNKKGVELNTL